MRYAGQGQVTASLVRLGPSHQMAHLRAQLPVFMPTQDDGFDAKQGLGDVAMRRARLRGIKRLQRAPLDGPIPSNDPLAALRSPVDAFFEDVMVNAEQTDLRLNRLGLLTALHAAMNRVADLSKLAS